MSQAFVEDLPELKGGEVCLREVHISDAEVLVALFARDDVSGPSCRLPRPTSTSSQSGSA